MINVYHQLYKEDITSSYGYLKKIVNNNSPVKVLITGATGLIGSYLADAMIQYNAEKAEAFDIYLMSRNLEKLKARFDIYDSKMVHYIEHDIHDPLDAESEYSYIFHLASNADPASYERYPYETITTNVLGTYNIIEYAKKHKDVRIIFTSTIEVYGESEKIGFVEADYFPIDFNKIRSGYPESKRVSELMYRSACKEYGIKSVIARMGYIYGPTMTETDNKVVAQFIRKASDKENIVLKSSGRQRRAFCYVADAVNGILTVLAAGNECEVYNISDNNSVLSIRELAELFSSCFELKLLYEFNEGNCKVNNTVLCSQLLMSLGWTCATDIKSGIIRSVKIFNGDKL